MAASICLSITPFPELLLPFIPCRSGDVEFGAKSIVHVLDIDRGVVHHLTKPWHKAVTVRLIEECHEGTYAQ